MVRMDVVLTPPMVTLVNEEEPKRDGREDGRDVGREERVRPSLSEESITFVTFLLF